MCRPSAPRAVTPAIGGLVLILRGQFLSSACLLVVVASRGLAVQRSSCAENLRRCRPGRRPRGGRWWSLTTNRGRAPGHGGRRRQGCRAVPCGPLPPRVPFRSPLEPACRVSGRRGRASGVPGAVLWVGDAQQPLVVCRALEPVGHHSGVGRVPGCPEAAVVGDDHAVEGRSVCGWGHVWGHYYL